MLSPIVSAIKQICEEKGIKEAEVLEAIESSLAAAYRKDFGKPQQNVKVTFFPENGEMKVVDVKLVVEDSLKAAWETLRAQQDDMVQAPPAPLEQGAEEELKFNPKLHITLTEARVLYPDAEIGKEVETPLEVPTTFGRVAAQTAKQVIIQKLKEAERNSIFEDFKDKEGKIVLGTVGRRIKDALVVEVGKGTAMFPHVEQIAEERYIPGNHFKFVITKVAQTMKGPEIVVSRASPQLVKEVFAQEIPEVANGLIEIKAVARDAGRRSKIAVISHKDNIDPVGSCIGQRGVRVQTVMAELGGEKIDIIQWHEDPAVLIPHALAPAKIAHIVLHEDTHTAEVEVPVDQLSLAIGKGGHNVRLASELTGWKIDLKELPVNNQAALQEETAEPEAEVTQNVESHT